VLCKATELVRGLIRSLTPEAFATSGPTLLLTFIFCSSA